MNKKEVLREYRVFYSFYDVFMNLLDFANIKYVIDYDSNICCYIIYITTTEEKHNYIRSMLNLFEEKQIIKI